MNELTNCSAPQKQTMWDLVNEILNKCYQIKNAERELAERLFWIWENEWKLTDALDQRWIEQMLFECRNVLDVIWKRLWEDIKNLE